MKAGNGGTGYPRKASAAMTGLSGTIKAKPSKRQPARFTPHAAPRQAGRDDRHGQTDMGMTALCAVASVPFRHGAEMGRLVLKALRAGLWGLLIGPLLAVI
ncbi:MAG TPA: hypothetical protein VIU82_08655, partial [Bosea sp. (in: a-proteobacteria)]